jgi:hypothetical protein
MKHFAVAIIFVLSSPTWALPALNELQDTLAFGSKPAPVPVTAKPVTAKPVAATPVTAKPVAATPVTAKPVAALTSPPTSAVPKPPPTAAPVTAVDDKVFLVKKDALPNIKGWTEFKGTSGSLDWKIGNIIPRAMDANVGFKAWSENGVPKIRITMSDTNTQLSAKENVRSLVETARLVDVSIDYFIKGNSWIGGKLVDTSGTTDIVILMKVDATIAYDATTKMWKMDKDAISFKPGGNIDFGAQNFIFNLFVDSTLDAVLSDFVTVTMVNIFKKWIPEQMAFALPASIRNMIENHLVGPTASTVLALNGQARWFLPVNEYKGTTTDLQAGWAWFQGGPTPNPTRAPTFDTMFKPNPLALPVFYKDLDGTGTSDYEVTNVVPHVANFQLVVKLIQNLKNMKPQLAIVLSGTCAAKNETCVSTPAKLELDVDYYFKHHLTRFTDKGTAKIALSVAFNAALEMNPDGKWALNTDDKITMAIDGEMKLENSRWAAIVNPALKLFFNDQLELLLASFIKTYFLPTIPSYLPEHYRMLLKEIIAKSAKNNMHFAGNIDLSIPRSPTTVYLQDRLQEQLELMDLQVASGTA